eukprot:Transcript_4677.p1 GENE.Transcript_4677~~Transcript_4677.p1  ORF type:complete len:371 (-),score=18.29 Transcript_4677:83-1195(-)
MGTASFDVYPTACMAMPTCTTWPVGCAWITWRRSATTFPSTSHRISTLTSAASDATARLVITSRCRPSPRSSAGQSRCTPGASSPSTPFRAPRVPAATSRRSDFPTTGATTTMCVRWRHACRCPHLCAPPPPASGLLPWPSLQVLVDPDSPDVGVGLGLPGLQPGEADASQMRDATHASEQEAIERDLLLAAQASQPPEPPHPPPAALPTPCQHDHQVPWCACGRLRAAPWPAPVVPCSKKAGVDTCEQDRSELDATQEAIEEAVMSASRAEWASHPAAAAGWYADYASGPGKFGKPEAPSWGGRAGGSDDDIPDMAAIGDGADDLDVSQPVANETVQQLLAMGFPLARALHAHEMFGDLENMLAFLTNN